MAGDGDKVNAISVALTIWEIMTQMSSVSAHRLSIWHGDHVLPNNLFISERWPSVLSTLSNELFDCSASWSNEKWLASDTIIEGLLSLIQTLHFLQECSLAA